MNLFKRGMIFATFFGSIIALTLLVTALSTKNWINASARRTQNPKESSGNVNFGLFEGRKQLNVAYGWRTYDINVLEMIKTERELLLYGLWVATICCLVGAMIFSANAVVFAAINTAATPYSSVYGVPGLYAWNGIAMVLSATAVSLWTVQFYHKLQYNVMTREDIANMWSSDHMATCGYSFWLACAASVVHLLNIIAIYVGTAEARREKHTPQPIIEEKANGAIMLY